MDEEPTLDTTTLTITLLPPLLAGGGRLSAATTHLDADALVAAAARHAEVGDGAVRVSLDQLISASEDEVKDLTSFLWRLRTEGADPQVVITHAVVMDACVALKLDRAFDVIRP